MSAELTAAIQAALAASQGLGWDTERKLEGGVWLTSGEAEQVRGTVRHAYFCNAASVIAPRPCNCGREKALAVLSAATPDVNRGTNPESAS